MYGLSDQYCDQWGCYDAAPSGPVTSGPQPMPGGGAGGALDSAASWVKQNSTAVYVGAGLLAALALFGGRRR